MIKYLLLVIVLTSCCVSKDTNGIKDKTERFEKICIHGVVYYSYDLGSQRGAMSIAFDTDGKIITCKKD